MDWLLRLGTVMCRDNRIVGGKSAAEGAKRLWPVIKNNLEGGE